MPYSAKQAIAKSTSERIPIMCDGSNLSNGNRKPVALVRMVKRRNIAVSPGMRFEPRSPNMTMIPETIAIRLMITCSIVKVDKLIPRIMTRSPFDPAGCYDSGSKIATCARSARRQFRQAAWIKKPSPWPIFLHGRHKTVRVAANILAIEKFDQFRDHLVGRFFHQPVTFVLDQHALDIGRCHLALLDQERAALFP